LLALAVVAGPLLFLNRSYPLMEPDEGRYAEVVREMVSSGDWVVPTLNHAPFLDKPPLFYWLVGGSFRAFGMTGAAARLVPTSAAFLTIVAIYLFGRRVAGARAAFLAALALALMGGFIQCGRVLILDSLLTLCVTLALLTAYEAVRGGQVRWAWWLGSALCCALGVLTKGPVALVLLAPPVAAHVWLRRNATRLSLAHWATYGGLVVGLAAPAYAAIIHRDPHFAYRFFVDQHLVRFFRNEYHLRPVWYYVPVLLVGCLPWSVLLVPLTRFLFSRSPEVKAARPKALGFFLLWAGWCVLFFSVSRSKLPPYVLPALPPAALLVGCYLDRVLSGKFPAVDFGLSPGTTPRLAALLLSAVLIAASLGAWSLGLLGPVAAFTQAGLCAGCLTGAACWGARLPARGGWLLCGMLGAGVAVVAAHEIVPAWSHRRDPLACSPAVGALLQDSRTAVVCSGGEWGSILFYLGRDHAVFNYSDQPPGELAKFLRRFPRSLLVGRHREDLQRLREDIPARMEIVPLGEAGDIRVALVRPSSQPGPARARNGSQAPAGTKVLLTPRSN
jgi:dolichol-phosphate mannosyltransferase